MWPVSQVFAPVTENKSHDHSWDSTVLCSGTWKPSVPDRGRSGCFPEVRSAAVIMGGMCEHMRTDCENRNWAKTWGTVQIRNGSFMWERKAPVLCVERLQEGVWILSQSWHGLKHRTECGKNSRDPPLLSQTFLQPLSVSFLSISRLNLDVSLKLLCFFSLLSAGNSCLSHSSRHELSPNAWNQPAGASDRAREQKWLLNKHFKQQQSHF